MIELKKVWLDGKLVDPDEARVGILCHTLHYGLAVFEGIRCYPTARGRAVFRLTEHVDRLFDSARICHIAMSWSREDIRKAIIETIRANGLEECYIRPIVFLGEGRMGILNKGVRVQAAIAVWKWGAYLGAEGVTQGVRCRVSSYTRHHVNVAMTKAKVSGNYANSQLAKREAAEDGYDEAIMLDPTGFVAEGTGENIFIVRRGTVITPPRAAILEGITRDSILTICNHLEVPHRQVPVTRDELHMADECFLTGTAAEVTPVREIDRRPVGEGRPGPITRKLQDFFMRCARGMEPEFDGWLTYVD